MDYTLDTNACIALFTAPLGQVMRMLRRKQDGDARAFVSSIVLYELRYGIAKSTRPQENSKRIDLLFGLGVEPLEFTHEEATVAAKLRAHLEARKQAIGPYDTLIAGHALARGLTLVTANHREFSRVEGLTWEDWSTL